MPSYNKVILIGNLTRDVELRYTQSGKAVAQFGLAVNEGTSDRQTTMFVDVEAWEKTAEICGKYLSKGSLVQIDGSLKLEQWEDKQTGARRSKHKVSAYNVQFLDSRQNASEAPARSRYADDDTQPARQPVPRPLRNSNPPPPDTTLGKYDTGPTPEEARRAVSETADDAGELKDDIPF